MKTAVFVFSTIHRNVIFSNQTKNINIIVSTRILNVIFTLKPIVIKYLFCSQSYPFLYTQI